MNQQEKATAIVMKLQDNGHQAMFAGGCVRDKLLGLEQADIDIATSATPDQVLSLFKKTKAVGKSFGVVLVREGDNEFEVATFRKDGNYTDGRHPDAVEFSDMQSDAERRDFTINAIFYDPINGMTFDFVDGLSDIRKKLIRFVGDPNDRINEDNLRILRAIRFALKLDFNFTYETWKAIEDNDDKILNVSAERINEELMKMVALGKPRKMFDLLQASGLMIHILPEVMALRGCQQNPEYHREGDVSEHTIRVMENLRNERPILQLAGMLHDVGKPSTLSINEDGKIINHGHDKVGAEMVETIMKRLKFSNDDTDLVKNLTSDHMLHHFVRSMKKATVKKMMALPHFDDLLKLNEADIMAASGNISSLTYIKEKRETWKPEEIKPKPIISGAQLIGLGLKPGPLFKEILNTVVDLQLEGELTTEAEAIAFVKRNYG
jgi:poly(A) polymerase